MTQQNAIDMSTLINVDSNIIKILIFNFVNRPTFSIQKCMHAYDDSDRDGERNGNGERDRNAFNRQ